MALFTCSKCNKRLGFDGLNVLCVCVDCKKSFCADEGTIFKNADAYASIAKGTNERIINDFLCYDCDKNRGGGGSGTFKPRTNEEIRKEAEKKQDAEFAKRQQEAEQAEVLRKKQELEKREAIAKAEQELKEKELLRQETEKKQLEAIAKAEQEKQQAIERAELEKRNKEHSARLIIPSFVKAEINIEFGLELKPCSGYLDCYGEQGAEASEICLSVYYADSQGIKSKKSYCFECGKLASEKISKITQINLELLQDKVKKKLREIYNNKEK